MPTAINAIAVATRGCRGSAGGGLNATDRSTSFGKVGRLLRGQLKLTNEADESHGPSFGTVSTLKVRIGDLVEGGHAEQ